MKLQDGISRIRVGSAPSKVFQHWEKTLDNKAKKITCIGQDCPLCKLGHQPTIRYQMKILDKVDPDSPQAKILETGASVIKQISHCVNDPELGDPTQYNLKITKSGIGRDTRYMVLASPKKYPLTQAEINMLDNLPSIQEINKELSAEEITKLPLQCFQDDNAEFTTPNPSGRDKTSALSDWDALN